MPRLPRAPSRLLRRRGEQEIEPDIASHQVTGRGNCSKGVPRAGRGGLLRCKWFIFSGVMGVCFGRVWEWWVTAKSDLGTLGDCRCGQKRVRSGCKVSVEVFGTAVLLDGSSAPAGALRGLLGGAVPRLRRGLPSGAPTGARFVPRRDRVCPLLGLICLLPGLLSPLPGLGWGRIYFWHE